MRSDICSRNTHFYKYARYPIIIEHNFVYTHNICYKLPAYPWRKIIRMAMNHQIRPPFGKALFPEGFAIRRSGLPFNCWWKNVIQLGIEVSYLPKVLAEVCMCWHVDTALTFWHCKLDKLALDFHELATEKRPNSVGFHTGQWDQLPLSTSPTISRVKCWKGKHQIPSVYSSLRWTMVSFQSALGFSFKIANGIGGTPKHAIVTTMTRENISCSL